MSLCFERPKGDLLIKAGQKVDFSTPLMRKGATDTITVNIASHLGITPADIFLSVKKVVGDEIKSGEVLAEKKTIMSVKKFISPHEGTVREINHEDGTMVIEIAEQARETMRCFFAGTVEKITEGQICLKVGTTREFALSKTDATFGGMVAFLESAEVAAVTQEKITDHVIFISTITPYEQAKIEALGAAGFVTASPLSTDEVPPKAVLSSKQDFAKIKDARLSYCLIDKKSDTLFLYK
jgi:glycine cleavage system H lipoate-binding protein